MKDEPEAEVDADEASRAGKIEESDPLDIGFHYLAEAADGDPRTREVATGRKKHARKREPVRYECRECSLIFSRKAKYERHEKRHEASRQESMRFDCETCALGFARKSELRRHMLKHSDEKPHKCEICDKSFKRSYEVTAHMDIHGGPKYTCEICNFTTAYKVSLKTHKRRVHQKDYPHKCDECGKGFMSRYELEDHRTCHLGTKSFVCEICGSAYSQKSYLLYHKRVIHGQQNRPPREHKCPSCDKTFASEYCLRNHVGLHSQKFLCSHCGKSFATNHSLKMHMRMHTGERPHKCNLCAKSFVRSNALAVHRLTHTGERPYVCDLCEKSFTQRTTMMIHRKKHPGSHPPPPPMLLKKLDSTADSSSTLA